MFPLPQDYGTPFARDAYSTQSVSQAGVLAKSCRFGKRQPTKDPSAQSECASKHHAALLNRACKQSHAMPCLPLLLTTKRISLQALTRYEAVKPP